MAKSSPLTKMRTIFVNISWRLSANLSVWQNKDQGVLLTNEVGKSIHHHLLYVNFILIVRITRGVHNLTKEVYQEEKGEVLFASKPWTCTNAPCKSLS